MLEYIKRSRTVDFTGYKRSSLCRRITKRMAEVAINDFAEYLDFLEVHPEEFAALFNTILINVTSFFRDLPDWEFLAQEVIQQIIKSKQPHESIRVWSAGCASGQEPYSLAILFAEALGFDNFLRRVKIYATDMDEAALSQARAANYSQEEISSVPEEYREKYFTKNGSGYSFKLDVRRAVIFGRHDLIQDPPISKLDLLVCRNTLMYLNAETQRKILSRLHFALNNQGYLFLGNAELMLTNGDLFKPLNLKHRIFFKTGWPGVRIFSRSFDQPVNKNRTDQTGITLLRDRSFENGLTAQLLLSTEGTLVLANEAARSTFGINESMLGSLFQDLELSYRPVELRSVIDNCYRTRKPYLLESIEYKNIHGNVMSLEVYVCPLLSESKLLGVSLTFTDVSKAAKLQNDLLETNQKLEKLNEDLQAAREELETSNEELQSTNEELETTNEELQSTNEELETMNEELQSTNEELETMNSELREISSELNMVNKLLKSVLSSLECAVIALNSKSEVLLWNDTAYELWGLRADEVKNKSIYDLDFGLPIGKLRIAIDAFLASDDHNAELKSASTSRRGKEFQCQIRLTKLIDNKNGLVMLIHPNP